MTPNRIAVCGTVLMAVVWLGFLYWVDSREKEFQRERVAGWRELKDWDGPDRPVLTGDMRYDVFDGFENFKRRHPHFSAVGLYRYGSEKDLGLIQTFHDFTLNENGECKHEVECPHCRGSVALNR